MDADGQHLAEELPVMVEPIVDGEADYGERLAAVGRLRTREPDPAHRRARLLADRLAPDRTADHRPVQRLPRGAGRLLQRLVLEQDQFWTSEILIEALRHRARVVEVPVTIVARSSGNSKKPKSLRYGWHFSKAIIQTWLR